jgi:hypothetical protein
MEITFIDHVKNEKVLPKVNEKRNILTYLLHGAESFLRS